MLKDPIIVAAVKTGEDEVKVSKVEHKQEKFIYMNLQQAEDLLLQLLQIDFSENILEEFKNGRTD